MRDERGTEFHEIQSASAEALQAGVWIGGQIAGENGGFGSAIKKFPANFLARFGNARDARKLLAFLMH